MSNSLPFGRISPGDRPPEHVVAYQHGEARRYDHWLGNVQQLSARLEGEATGFWPVFFEDRYDFSIALCALWSSGRTPVLLPDVSEHTLERLAVPIAGYLGDLPPGTREVLPWRPQDDPELSDVALTPDCRTALSTSGTTGDALLIEKTPTQLLTELDRHCEIWGMATRDAVFLATVSHQHIYGLLFTLLIPFHLGRPFEAKMFSNPRSVLLEAARYGNAAWVASPAQLKRVTPELVEDLNPASVQTIFSSGGLLEPHDARTVEHLFRSPAHEVYGSTETGAIGYRQQFSGRQPNLWQVFPQVEMRNAEDDVLEVKSPYTGEVWLKTGDRVALKGNDQFELLGRADRIAKLEEKRISLTATERELEALDTIEQARCVVLPGRRQQLAAVVVLTNAGTEVLGREGRNPLVRAIREALLARLEHHAVPRRFRFVPELPTSTQGKIRAVDLADLFEHGDGNVLPIVTRLARGDDEDQESTVSLDLKVPGDLDYFEGHFEDFPVVPGVVQLMWVRHFARLHLGFGGDVRKMSQVKFKAMLRPGDAVTLSITLDADRGRLKYRLSGNGNEYSSGVLRSADG